MYNEYGGNIAMRTIEYMCTYCGKKEKKSEKDEKSANDKTAK